MGSSPKLIGVLSATLIFGGCGRIGLELLGLDAGGVQPSDAGADDLDAGPIDELDAGGMDASATYDAGALDAGALDAGALDAGALDAGALEPCDLSGTWATKIEVDLSWITTYHFGLPAVMEGSGPGRVWIKHQATADGSIVPGSMVACGMSVPPMDFGAVGAGGGTGQVSFNIPLFDTAPPATTSSSLQVQGAGFPEDPISWSPTALLLGATMADPVSGTWPSSRTGVTQVDIDGDGHDGVSLPHLNTDGLVYLPTVEFPSSDATNQRADLGYYAWRLVWSATGTLMSCDEMAGGASVTAFDSHVLGCRRANGDPCVDYNADLLDNNRPAHVPGETATYRATKVSEDDVPCATIRSALP